jgi:exodeoxyribonuclease VIII
MNEATYNVPFADYSKWSGLSPSKVKLAGVSLLAFMHYEQNGGGEHSSAMVMGSAVHCAVLEPDLLPLRYVTWPGARRGKVWTQFKAANADKEIITAAEYGKALQIRDAVRRHDLAKKLLDKIRAEVSLRWTDDATAMKCKGRLDALRDDCYIDLKTIGQLTERSIRQNIIDFGYCLQGAAYGIGAMKCGLPYEGKFIFVGSNPPHDVAVVPLTDEMRMIGEAKWRKSLDIIAEARRTNFFPGIAPTDELIIDMPEWYVENNIELIGAERGN